MKTNDRSSIRYIALDIHKHYAVVAAVDREGDVLLKPRKVTNEQLLDWATAHLFSEDRVVIESTTNAWHVYDLLAPLVAEVKVANPIRIKQIAEARTKTDKRDALILARLLAAKMIPEDWVPPVHVRELRQLITHGSANQATGHHEPSVSLGCTGHVPVANPWLRRDHHHDRHRCDRRYFSLRDPQTSGLLCPSGSGRRTERHQEAL